MNVLRKGSDLRSTAEANRRAGNAVTTGRKSTALPDANVAARTNVAASKAPVGDRDVAERFSALVVPFSAGDLARAAHRTKAAAKGWKDASRAPSLASVINMARQIPAVRQWLYAAIDKSGDGAQFDMESPRFLASLIGAVHKLSQMPGPDGDAVRAALSGSTKED